MFLDATGALAFALSSPQRGDLIVSTAVPLLAQKWYLVSASYDAETGDVAVVQRPLKHYPVVNDAAGRIRHDR